jgi:hypothetical protein
MPPQECKEPPLQLAAGRLWLDLVAEREPKDLGFANGASYLAVGQDTFQVRSAIVRAGVVTGMPLRRVVAVRISVNERCRRMPLR